VRMRVSADRFPTTTRSISSSTSTARAVVVAAGMAVSEVMFDAYPLSYLLQPFQDFLERRAARSGFGRTGARNVVGVHPRPQLRAEKHSASGIEGCRV